MTDANARGTIHFRVGGLATRIAGPRSELEFPSQQGGYLGWLLRSTEPEHRQDYAWAVMSGWFVLAFAFIVGIGVLAFPARSLLGSDIGDVLAYGCAGTAMFCIAGGCNALWRLSWYVPQARRRARTHGSESEQFARSMRRALPRNSSLVFQSVVGVLTYIVAAP